MSPGILRLIDRIEVPPSRMALSLLALAFLLPGMTGHDPWKTLDVVSVDIAYRMQQSGDWLVPRLAGEVWFEDTPVYHWLALFCGKALGWLIEFHDAARLASGICMLLAAGALFYTAKTWSAAEQRTQASAAAALLLLGSVGLFIHAHEAMPELATLAALSLAFAALCKAPAQGQKMSVPLRALGLGAGLAVSFFSGGWAAPAAILAAAVATLVSSSQWRNPGGLLALFAGCALGVGLAALWPLALWHRDPNLLALWMRHQGVMHDPPLENARYFLVTSLWFLWPAWPLALWALWSKSSQWREPSMLVPLAALLVGLPVLAVTGRIQDVKLVVILAPVVLLGAQGAPKLLRGAAAALDWFGVMLFAFFTGVIWVAYVAMLTGYPPRIARNFLRVTPGFLQPLEPFALVFAVLLALTWFYVVFRSARGPTRSLLRWMAGATLLWGTFAMLWMPWVDHQRSYRSVAMQLRSHIPAGTSCIYGRNLGNAQRAAFDYHAGIVTRRFDKTRPRACVFLLVQGEPRHEGPPPGKDWVRITELGRPGDKAERYRLYRLAR